MFSEKPEWDIERKYSADTVNMYFEHKTLNELKNAVKVTKIDTKTCTLSKALTLLRYNIFYHNVSII